MKEQKKLTIQMSLFFLFVVVAFGFIILDELGNPILKQKTEEKIDQHIKEKYKQDFNTSSIQYNKNKKQYEKKVSHKKNENLFFIVSYKNKKIKDTYKTSYLEGQSLIHFYEKKFTKDLVVKKYPKIKVMYSQKLNDFNEVIQETLIENQKVKDLRIYDIYDTNEIANFNQKYLTTYLKDLNLYLNKKGYKPKVFNLILVNKENPLESISIKDLDSKYLTDENITLIVNSILLKDQSIAKQFGFTYQYNNQGG